MRRVPASVLDTSVLVYLASGKVEKTDRVEQPLGDGGTIGVQVPNELAAMRFGFSTYDAMIVAAAILSGCTTLWTGDMRLGTAVDGGLRILNPFRPD